jgi:glutamate-1-semialdehyde 2,1-aminomutase
MSAANPKASGRIEAAYCERFSRSATLFERSVRLFPSGVTHDSRYLQPFPVFANEASGSKKLTVDGPELIDYWVGHGALLLGHSHPAIVEAVQKQVALSTHPGACHELEVEWGEWIRRLVPSAELMRFTNSGTEATLMAIRVCRIATGRTKVIKFAGHFHGWHDAVIISSEPPHPASVLAGGDPVAEEYATPGVTPGVYGDVVIVPPNDIAALSRAIDEHHPACVIHEGNGARWGVVPARPDFIQAVRQLTSDKHTLFILDEVITGFRVSPGGFQEVCDVRPDLSTFAKVLAGGLPGGVLVGRADLMQVLAFGNPTGKKMKHPGTYNGNPLSAAAGIACLKIVATGEPNQRANQIAALLRRELNSLFAKKSVNWVAYGDYSAIKILPEYDGPRPAGDDFIPFGGDWRKLDRKLDAGLSQAFRCALLLGGVDWMGWGGSTSAAHTEEDVARTVAGFSQAIDLLRADGFVA